MSCLKAYTARTLMFLSHTANHAAFSSTDFSGLNPLCQSFAGNWEAVMHKTAPLPSKGSQSSWEHRKVSKEKQPVVFHVIVGVGVRYWCSTEVCDAFRRGRESWEGFIEEVSGSWFWRLHRSFQGIQEEKRHFGHRSRHLQRPQDIGGLAGAECWEHRVSGDNLYSFNTESNFILQAKGSPEREKHGQLAVSLWVLGWELA